MGWHLRQCASSEKQRYRTNCGATERCRPSFETSSSGHYRTRCTLSENQPPPSLRL